jgi:hypothetical protein
MKWTSLKNASLVMKAAEIKDAIDLNGRVSFRMTNNDLMPIIEEGDKIKVIKANPSTILQGDIVMLVSQKDVRIRRVKSIRINHGIIEYNLASNKPRDEAIVNKEHIFGRVVEVTKGTRKIRLGMELSLWNLFFGDLKVLYFRSLTRDNEH